MIELIRKTCKQGDIVKITLDGGREITGALDEISSEHLTLIVDECPVILTHKIIVLFEIVKKRDISRVVSTNAPDNTPLKSAETITTTKSEESQEVSIDDAPATSQSMTSSTPKKIEFSKDNITNYNDALSYCSYLEGIDIGAMVNQLDFKYDDPAVSKNSIDKKLKRISITYVNYQKDPDLDLIQPAIAEINSLYSENPRNLNLNWDYFILSSINRDYDSAFNCLHAYSLGSSSFNFWETQDFYIYLLGQTRFYDKLEELIRHFKSTAKESTQLVEFTRKALIYMLYKCKMNSAIESALRIDDNNLLATTKELTNKVPRKSIYPYTPSTPRQPLQRTISKPQKQTKQFYNLTEEINSAVSSGDVSAVDSLYRRYKSHKDATKLIQIGTAYQRLGQYEKAIQLFNYGL